MKIIQQLLKHLKMKKLSRYLTSPVSHFCIVGVMIGMVVLCSSLAAYYYYQLELQMAAVNAIDTPSKQFISSSPTPTIASTVTQPVEQTVTFTPTPVPTKTIPTSSPTNTSAPLPTNTPQPYTPTPIPAQGKPVMDVSFPKEGQSISLNSSQTFCAVDVPVSNARGIIKKKNINNAGWTEYGDVDTTCYDPAEGANTLQFQYKNDSGQESDVYTIHFTFHHE